MKNIITLLVFLMSFVANASDVPVVSQQQLLSLKSAEKAPEFIVLDVRTTNEYNEQHIDGAINISHDAIESKLASLKQYKNTMIIVHCRSGKRADIAETILVKNGFLQVKHLAGDMNGWIAADLPVIRE